MTDRRSRELTLAGIKFGAFAMVAVSVTLTVAATIRPFGNGGVASYHAIFANASRLKSGDDVRAAGVVVGRVDGVRLLSDDTVDVAFTLTSPVPLTSGTQAQIRYLDLIGDRTLALVNGPGERLPDGGTIPLAHTQPALDLNALFNGFKPLFAALSPNDINALSLDIVRTLQGEGPTVDALMQQTATLTRTLADRDTVIGQVITNLNTVLGTVDDRQGQVNLLVRDLTRFVRGTAADRDVIGTAIDQVGQLAQLTRGLISQARPSLHGDIAALGQLAHRLNQPINHLAIEQLLTQLGPKLGAISRTASNGSFFNYYACALGVHLADARGLAITPGLATLGSLLDPTLGTLATIGTITLSDGAARCR